MSADTNLKQKTFNGVLWSALDRFVCTGLAFVFNLMIARILMPEDYGIIAMIGIFLAICNCFIDSGFSNALIRKPDRTEIDFNTVFYFNVVVSVFLYSLLFLCAPLIANFYGQPLLTKVTRLVGLNLVINSLSTIQNTKLSIELQFKSKSIISIISVAITGAVGLYLALKGFEVMALVFQGLASSSIRTALLCLVCRWKPSLIFSWTSFKQMFSFGSKLLASSLIDTVYNNVYTLVIGKVFNPTSLGYYSRADLVAQFPSSSMTGMLQSVSFPVLSSIQTEEERLKSSYRKFLKISAYVIFPMMIGLAAVADPFVRVILTDKWARSIPMLQILCFALMWYPIHSINLNLLQVKGRSDYFLKLEVIKKIIGIATLCFTIPLGLIPMCLGRIFTSVICLPINTYYTKKLIGYGIVEQMRDILPIIVLSAVMGILVVVIVNTIPMTGAKLFIGIVSGVCVYLAGSVLFKFPEWAELCSLLKNKLAAK